MGESATLIEDDGSSMPFKVRFPDSITMWFIAADVALAGEPSTKTALEHLEEGAIAPLVTLVQSGTAGQKKHAASALRILAINAENEVFAQEGR